MRYIIIGISFEKIPSFSFTVCKPYTVMPARYSGILCFD